MSGPNEQHTEGSVVALGIYTAAIFRVVNIQRGPTALREIKRLDRLRELAGWYHFDFCRIYDWALQEVVRTTTIYERQCVAEFRERLADLIPGATIIKPRRGPKYEGLCDLLVSVSGEERPVEVKRGNFDAAAASQLRRYMDWYGARIGYAVASELTVTLSADMLFFRLDHRPQP